MGFLQLDRSSAAYQKMSSENLRNPSLLALCFFAKRTLSISWDLINTIRIFVSDADLGTRAVFVFL
jgi:hypothetical protein